ncbi:MAG: hypothetical protein KUG56_09265 [Kordiimonadaceae bacterium]|nr:hypothetical protein [Kordiimonadaceae bacterium]
MKSLLTTTALISMASAPAWAHAGDHHSGSISSLVSHFVSHPYHSAITAALVVGAAATFLVASKRKKARASIKHKA